MRAAAERAPALGSHHQAVAFLRDALSITSVPADQADLLERAGEPVSASGRHDQAERLLREAVARRESIANTTGTIHASVALGRSLPNAFRTEEAIALLEARSGEFADLRSEQDMVALVGGWRAAT